MKEKRFLTKDLVLFVPLSLTLSAWFSSLQEGNWLLGFSAFFLLFFLSLILLRSSHRWSEGGKKLGLILTLAFAIRLLVGVSLHLALPVYGHEDEDDRAGFVFTDAHRRDVQAWELASSDSPILNAFSQKFAYDQYGGLLAFSALVYRYFSPDAHRPLMLVLLSALAGTLGVPFLWRAIGQVFGERVAFASAWIFALYPESILLGSSAMREPYLLMFSAMSLWGFAAWRLHAEPVKRKGGQSAPIWLGFGLLGMLLISPSIAIITLVLFAGWMFFAQEGRSLPWRAILIFVIIFIAALLFLSASLDRSGEFETSSPLRVVNDWLRLAVKWNAYQIERDSGWVQKLFDEMPDWMRLPFVAVYGIFQPVLPAAFVAPAKVIWKIIYILRALGWYTLLPLLILSFIAGSGSGCAAKRAHRNVILWLSLLAWTWILLSALRGGGDMWDNPRYRTILLVWQSMLAGVVWVWWRETRNRWFMRVLACEGVFLLMFTQWYLSRYYHIGGQLPFAVMVALILGLWGGILGVGWWLDKSRA